MKNCEFELYIPPFQRYLNIILPLPLLVSSFKIIPTSFSLAVLQKHKVAYEVRLLLALLTMYKGIWFEKTNKELYA